MILKALPLVHFWSVLLLKEQMMTLVRKMLKTLVWSVQNRSISSEICLENNHKIGRFLMIAFWWSLPWKLLWNSCEIGQFFREFVPKNPAKFDLFFHNLSEALLRVAFIPGCMLLLKVGKNSPGVLNSIQQKFQFEISLIPHAQHFNFNNSTFRCTDPTQASTACYCSCKQDTKERYWGQQFCQMERDILVQPTKMTRPVKVDHLQSWSGIFRSDQTEKDHSIWSTNWNFWNFWLNGNKAPQDSSLWRILRFNIQLTCI